MCLFSFRGGIIQPSIIGEDGKPMPVAHVLELAEGMGVPRHSSESDEN